VGKKKLVALVSVVAIVMGLLAVAGPSAAADKVFHWKFQSHHTAGSLAVERVIKPFIERVEKMSGGRLKISLHYAGELVDYAEVDKALQDNMIQISNTSTLFFRGSIPMGWVSAPNMPPFITRTNDEFNELFHHRGVDRLVNEALEERGIKYFGSHSVGNTYFWSKKTHPDPGGPEGVQSEVLRLHVGLRGALRGRTGHASAPRDLHGDSHGDPRRQRYGMVALP